MTITTRTIDTYAPHHEAITYALDHTQAQLREDLAVMLGSEAEHYTDEEASEVEARIASLDEALAALRA